MPWKMYARPVLAHGFYRSKITPHGVPHGLGILPFSGFGEPQVLESQYSVAE